MIEVKRYIITFSNGNSSIRKGFEISVFVADEIDLTIFRYEISHFFKVSVVEVELVSRVNDIKLWHGDLKSTCKFGIARRYKYLAHLQL